MFYLIIIIFTFIGSGLTIKEPKKVMDGNELNIFSVFNKINDAVFVCNLNYGKTLGNFIEVNNTSCRMLGYSRKELTEKNLISISAINNEDQIVEIIGRLITEGELIFDMQLLTKSNSIVPFEMNSILTDIDGHQIVIFSARKTTGRERVEAELKKTSEQLRNLSLHLQSVREEERAYIARELHDELGQMLTALKIQITLLSKKLRRDQADIKNKAKILTVTIESSIVTVRKLASKLRPGILDELGLIPAIEWQAQEFSRLNGIICSIELPETEPHFEKEISTAIFRILQEALTNIVRHANASRVKILFKETKDNFVVEITDNGKGITASRINDPKSLGLLGMQERALLFGGKVFIKKTMNSGTTVQVEIPIKNIRHEPPQTDRH